MLRSMVFRIRMIEYRNVSIENEVEQNNVQVGAESTYFDWHYSFSCVSSIPLQREVFVFYVFLSDTSAE